MWEPNSFLDLLLRSSSQFSTQARPEDLPTEEEMSSTAARSATTLSSLLANPNSANGNTSEKPVASGGSAAVVSPPNGGSSPPAPGVTMAPTADDTLSSPSANKDITYEGIVNVLATSARGATVVGGGESASSPPESSSPPGGVVSTTRVSTGDDETGPSSSPARFRSVGGGSPSMSHDALLRLKEICDMTSSVESTPTAPGPSESTPGPASYIKADPSEQPSPTSYIRADHSEEPAPVASYIQVNPSEPMAGPSKPSAPFIPDNIRSLMEQDNGQMFFQCHICPFNSHQRWEFNLHINEHYQFVCPKCDFVTKDEELWTVHLANEHQCTPLDLEDEQGVSTPRVNSQGKVKTFKCKKCDAVFNTKEVFWIHSRSHIKPEKMLHCAKCIFVTEFKHHLEYHVRNHFGAKPLKCPHCNYTCVNKSMLNSHMKSHVTTYMYRCAECQYATKYCHSLKLHLRKYNHKADVVLNADGTPNPLPIVDVYGTRRGPKRKPEESGGITDLTEEHYLEYARKRNASEDASGSGSSGEPSTSCAVDALQTPPRTGTHDGRTKEERKRRKNINGVVKRSRKNGDSNGHSNGHTNGHTNGHSNGTNGNGLIKDPDAAPHGANVHPDMFQPAYVIAQQMHQLQKMHQSAVAAARIAQVPPFNRGDTLVAHPGSSTTTPPPTSGYGGGYPPQMSPSVQPADLKCTMCPFETGNREVYENHMSLHSKQDSQEEQESKYLDYIRKIHQAASAAATTNAGRTRQTSPPTISSTVTSGMLHHGRRSPPAAAQSPVASQGQAAAGPFNTESHLLTRLYLENMAKNAAAAASGPSKDCHALDLRQDSTRGVYRTDGPELSVPPPPRPPQAISSESTSSSSGQGGVSSTAKRSRKSKAFKIERKRAEGSNGGGGANGKDGNSSTASGSPEPNVTDLGHDNAMVPAGKTMVLSAASEEEEAALRDKGLRGKHICKYCELAFMDSVMYTIHMGYHGFSDPFTCNTCGEQTNDQLSFFLHIARKPHN